MRISDWSSDVCSSDLAFGPVELDLAVVAVPAHRKMAVARERAIFDAVGDEFVDRERQRLRRFVVELDLGTGDGGEPFGRYARQFEFAADDAAALDAADRAADEHLLRVGTRAHTIGRASCRDR